MLAGKDTGPVLEELCWLMRCSAHLVADPGEGEVAEVPLPLLPPCTAAAAAREPCPLTLLSQEMLSLASSACCSPSPSTSPRWHVVCCRLVIAASACSPVKRTWQPSKRAQEVSVCMTADMLKRIRGVVTPTCRRHDCQHLHACRAGSSPCTAWT